MSYVQSRVWYDRAAVIPGRSNTRSKAPGRLFDIERGPLYVRASAGATVRDVDGNNYIDMICGLGAVSLGHGQFWPSGGGVCSLPHYAEVEAAEAVLQHVAPWASQVRFVRTGSEALTGAVMMARKATGRRPVFVAKNSYHGWHPWTSQREEPGTDGADTKTYYYGDVQDVIRLATIGDLPAAIVVEPARWEVTPPGYLFALQAVARHLGAFFIVDEMIYGGRWALGGACDVNRLTPDLACYGKAFGNGAPVAFIVGTDALARHGELISGTYSGDVGAARAVVETVGVYTSTPVINTLWERGKQLWEGVSEAVQTTGWVGRAFCDGVAPVHGRLRFTDAAGVISPDLAKTFAGQMAKRGVLWHPDLTNVMAAHTVEQMAFVVAAAGHSLAEMAPPR